MQLTSNIKSLLIKALFVLGLFFPTSIQAQIAPSLEILSWLVLIVLISLFIFSTRTVNVSGALLGMLIVLILSIATLISPFQEYAYGAMLPFLGFCLLITARWKRCKSLPGGEAVLFYSSIIMLTASVLIITNSIIITNFIKIHYSAFYPELLTIMFDWGRKPVLTFGTHSIAGFYFFIFFFLNFRTFEHTRERRFFIVSLLFLLLSLFLRSVTAYSFTFISVLYLGSRIYNRPKILLSTIFGIFTLSLIVFYVYYDLLTFISFAQLLDTFSSEGNGLNGRYSSTSSLLPMILYIKENPLRPVGLSNSSDFFFGDSGFIILYLRGSIFLVVIFYGAFVLFVKNTLNNTKDKMILIMGFLLFELGFINLGYTRTIYMLPFILTYLNHLKNTRKIGESCSIYGNRR